MGLITLSRCSVCLSISVTFQVIEMSPWYKKSLFQEKSIASIAIETAFGAAVGHIQCNTINCKLSCKYSNIYPTRCNVTQFILSGNCSTCFGWSHHPSSGMQTSVSTASGICHTITATCRYRGTGWNWKSWNWFECAVAHSNQFQPVPRQRQVAVMV